MLVLLVKAFDTLLDGLQLLLKFLLLLARHNGVIRVLGSIHLIATDLITPVLLAVLEIGKLLLHSHHLYFDRIIEAFQVFQLLLKCEFDGTKLSHLAFQVFQLRTELLYFLFHSLQLFSRIVFVEERAQPLDLLAERLDRDDTVVEPLLYQEFIVTLLRQLLAHRVQLVSQTRFLCHYFFDSRPHIVNLDFERVFVRFQLGDLVKNIDRQLGWLAADADRNDTMHLQLLLRRRRTLDRVYISRLEWIPSFHGV